MGFFFCLSHFHTVYTLNSNGTIKRRKLLNSSRLNTLVPSNRIFYVFFPFKQTSLLPTNEWKLPFTRSSRARARTHIPTKLYTLWITNGQQKLINYVFFVITCTKNSQIQCHLIKILFAILLKSTIHILANDLQGNAVHKRCQWRLRTDSFSRCHSVSAHYTKWIFWIAADSLSDSRPSNNKQHWESVWKKHCLSHACERIIESLRCIGYTLSTRAHVCRHAFTKTTGRLAV